MDGTDIVARDLTVNRNATFNNGFSVTSGYANINSILTAANATISGNLTVNGMTNSHATGSTPIAGSNAGMILDCYTLLPRRLRYSIWRNMAKIRQPI